MTGIEGGRPSMEFIPRRKNLWEGVSDTDFLGFLHLLEQNVVVGEKGEINYTQTLDAMLDFIDPPDDPLDLNERQQKLRSQSTLTVGLEKAGVFNKTVSKGHTPHTITDTQNTLLGLSFLYARMQVSHENHASRVRTNAVLSRMTDLWGEHPMTDVVNEAQTKIQSQKEEENAGKRAQRVPKAPEKAGKDMLLLDSYYDLHSTPDRKKEAKLKRASVDSVWIRRRLQFIAQKMSQNSVGAMSEEANWGDLEIDEAVGWAAEFVREANSRDLREYSRKEFVTLTELRNGLVIAALYMEKFPVNKNLNDVYERVRDFASKFPDNFSGHDSK